MAGYLMSPLAADTWHKTLSQTDGRDKLFRLIQYVCKLLRGLDHGRTTPPSSARTAKVFDLERALSTSRQIWRLFKWASVYAKAKPRAASLTTTPPPPDVAAIISDAGLFGYYIFDNLTFLAKVGLLRSDIGMASRRAARFWLLANVAGLTGNLYRANELRKQYREAVEVAREKKEEDGGEGGSVRMGSLLKLQRMTLAICAKNASDVVVAWSLCRDSPFHPALVGACGSVSSVVGFYQVWPKYMPTG